MKQRFWGLRGSKLRALIWGEACVGVMIFGYNQGSAGSVLGDYTFERQFPRMDTLDTQGTQKEDNATILGQYSIMKQQRTQLMSHLGTVVALYTLFGAFGALICTFLGDVVGRRKTIFVATITQAVGATLQASSFQLPQYIIGRIFLGLGTGAIIATVSVWQAEVSTTENRGKHVSAFGVFTTIGLALAYWIAFGMSYTQPSSVSWRFVLVFPVLNSLIVGTTILSLPESPRWLCKMNRPEEAREILSILHDNDSNSSCIDQEINNIEVSLEISGKWNLGAMLKMGPQRTFHRVLLAVGVQILLQMSGINA